MSQTARTTTPTAPASSPVLTGLRISALMTALLSIVQPVLYAVSGGDPATSAMSFHGLLGMVTALLAIVAAVMAFLWARQGGNRGLMFHAASVAVMALVQVALGEAGAGNKGLIYAHMGLGVLILVAAAALVTLAYRKPVATA